MGKFKATTLMEITVTAESEAEASRKFEHIKKHGFFKLDVLAVPVIQSLDPAWVQADLVPEQESQ